MSINYNNHGRYYVWMGRQDNNCPHLFQILISINFFSCYSDTYYLNKQFFEYIIKIIFL